LSVFTSETASAPARSAAAATAHALEQALGLGRVGAHHEACLDVRAGDVELDQGDLGPHADRPHQPLDLLGAEAHHGDDQRDRQLRQGRQVLAQEALEALVGQPDRVDQASRGLEQARRRVALARLDGDRLRDERVEGEALEQCVAEGAPGRDRVEGARAVENRAFEEDAAEVDPPGCGGQCPAPGKRALSSRSASTTGPSTHNRR
jgi:hypothetical protein